MKREKPYKLRAIVENGRGESASLKVINIPYISEETTSLIIDSINCLDLAGRLDSNGNFRQQEALNKKTQKLLPYYTTKLKPRVIILEDGRLFYNKNCEDPRGGGDFPDLRGFLNNEFSNKQFLNHFDSLYRKFNN